MVGAVFSNERIADYLIAFLLHQLLELGFIVHVVELRHRHLHQNKPLNEAQRRHHPAIQEGGRNH